jgi:DNA-binding protein HU-beta
MAIVEKILDKKFNNFYKPDTMANKIGKTQLIQEVSKDSDMSQAAVEKVLNSLLSVGTKNLKKGNNVVITGYGTFKVTKTKERMGVNPQTGAKIKIASSMRVSFSAGQTLKNIVNGR